MADIQHHSIDLPPCFHPHNPCDPLSNNYKESWVTSRDLFPHKILLSLWMPILLQTPVPFLRANSFHKALLNRFCSHSSEKFILFSIYPHHPDLPIHSWLLPHLQTIQHNSHKLYGIHERNNSSHLPLYLPALHRLRARRERSSTNRQASSRLVLHRNCLN